MIILTAFHRTASFVPACLLAAASTVCAPGLAADVQQLLGGKAPAVTVPAEPAVPRRIVLVGIDVVGDPGDTPASAADSPAESSGAFDAIRGDLGADDDLGGPAADRRRRGAGRPAAADRLPDPLRNTERIDPAVTGPDAAAVLDRLLPPRTDTAADWYAPGESLHDCGEPRLLPPCVPPPPCHPSLPPHPYDLVGVAGMPTCGPIYRGPCAPRSATQHTGALKHLQAAHDRLFDWFYRSK